MRSCASHRPQTIPQLHGSRAGGLLVAALLALAVPRVAAEEPDGPLLLGAQAGVGYDANVFGEEDEKDALANEFAAKVEYDVEASPRLRWKNEAEVGTSYRDGDEVTALKLAVETETGLSWRLFRDEPRRPAALGFDFRYAGVFNPTLEEKRGAVRASPSRRVAPQVDEDAEGDDGDGGDDPVDGDGDSSDDPADGPGDGGGDGPGGDGGDGPGGDGGDGGDEGGRGDDGNREERRDAALADEDEIEDSEQDARLTDTFADFAFEADPALGDAGARDSFFSGSGASRRFFGREPTRNLYCGGLNLTYDPLPPALLRVKIGGEIGDVEEAAGAASSDYKQWGFGLDGRYRLPGGLSLAAGYELDFRFFDEKKTASGEDLRIVSHTFSFGTVFNALDRLRILAEYRHRLRDVPKGSTASSQPQEARVDVQLRIGAGTYLFVDNDLSLTGLDGDDDALRYQGLAGVRVVL